MKIDPNDMAFPAQFRQQDGTPIAPNCGLTIRAHFAAMAMQGVVTFCGGHAAPVAEQAVKYADALIAELNK